MAGWQFTAVVALMLVHLFGARLRALGHGPRNWWLSLAGGMSIAYVFVHLLPELATAQAELGAHGPVAFLEHHAYLVALAGLVAAWGLERVVRCSASDPGGAEHEETRAQAGVFWLHVGSFMVYNALVGYLIVQRQGESLRSLAVFAIAMGLHFLINDNALRREHKRTYHRIGRWLLSASVLAGWLAGLVADVGAAATGALFALLAGGVVLNVLKEELPEERAGRFLPFLLGAAAYALLLLLE